MAVVRLASECRWYEWKKECGLKYYRCYLHAEEYRIEYPDVAPYEGVL